MKILITNHRLKHRGGSEMFTLEIARALAGRGHEVCAFSTVEGEVSQAIEKDGIRFVPEPDQCLFTPDIIHGHHHLEAMAAVAAWPGVPAIYHMHGYGPWEEVPPVHPRLLKYFGTAPRMAWWIARVCEVPEAEVGNIRNFFDPARYRTVRSPGEKTGRALVYLNNLSRESDTFLELEKACREAGMELDGLGTNFGKSTEAPEDVLPGYDLVFAGGRSAIEAMACGCASIPITRETMGERIHPGNFDAFREMNYCADLNDPKIEASRALEEIRRIDPAETAKVTGRIRAEATIDVTVDTLVDEYSKVIDRFAQWPPTDPGEEFRALSRYLCWTAAHVKDADARRHEIVDQKKSAEERAVKWQDRAGEMDRRLEWLEEKFQNAPWWNARMWRRLRREWEAREKNSGRE